MTHGPARKILAHPQRPNEALLAILTEHADARIQARGNVCLWCDEYFRKHDQRPRVRRETQFVPLESLEP